MLQGNLGDLARHVFLNQQMTRLKNRTSSLAQEMSTGQSKDIAATLQGRVGILASLEKSRNLAEAHRITALTLSQRLDMQQSVVTEVSVHTDKAMDFLLVSEQAGGSPALDRALASAPQRFEDVIQLLNTRFAGRSLFAGIAADQPAVVTAAQMLEALASDLSVPTDAAALSDHVDRWFAPGGGFDSAGYNGSAAIPNPVSIGHGLVIRNDITAQDPALRQTLAAFAKTALFSKTVTDPPIDDKRQIITKSREALLNARSALVDLGARLGVEQEKAASGKMRAEAQKTSLSITISDLVAVDPYAAASALEETLTQLDTILAVTVRLSRLSLANYLR